MTEEQVFQSILKVIKPYEGTAFVAVPDIAVSCIHVVVRDGADPREEHDVVLEYYSIHEQSPDRIHACYLPEQSDPNHDLAVLKLKLPEGLSIPPLPLSRDDQAGEEVVTVGFPSGQNTPRPVPGVVEQFYRLAPVAFEPDGWTCSVLQFDTHGQGFGSWGEKLVYEGMSGGPIWNNRTQTVVAVVEGRKARGALGDAPQGYGITLDHLAKCSTLLRPYIKEPSPQEPTLSPTGEAHQPRGVLGRLHKWVATHGTLALAMFILVAAVIGYWLAERLPPPVPEDLLEKEIGCFEPYGKAEYQKEDSRLSIHYSGLENGYNGCYINFSFDTAAFRTLVINAEGRLNGAQNVPKEFVVELKKQGPGGLEVVAQYKVSPSGQDVRKLIPRKGTIDQITIVFYADKVGIPEGTIYINKFVLGRKE